jgi:hypothetical protein
VRDRLAGALATVLGLAVLGPLAGCSGTTSYCSSLRDQKPALSRLADRSGQAGATGTEALARTVAVLGDLRDRAPDDISDEWVTLVDALQAVSDAVRDSGAAPEAFAGGRRPPGVTAGQLDAVQQAAAELGSTRVQQAGKSIEQHALDVCGVDLGSGLGGVGG